MRQVLERLLNLLAFLLTAGRPATAEEIRNTVAGYDRGSDEAFRRMFERDKELLRGLGIPVETRPTDAWEVEYGYVVPPERYRLPDPGLTDEELAALWLAAQVVRLGGQPSGPEALFKLGGGATSGAGEPLAADLGPDVELLAQLFEAVSERRMVGFGYRGKARRLAPYGLVHQRGHWYLVGLAGTELRSFRVDRIDNLKVADQPDAFTKPAGFRLRTVLPTAPWEAGEERITASIVFSPEVAWWAERQLSGAAKVRRRKDGSLVVTMPVANADALVGWLIGFGSEAVVEAPPQLRRLVVDRVRGVA